MLTTFARIAKILKGLVEPRNWVEEAFGDISGGGGGDSGTLILHEDENGALDKTWNEIHDAFGNQTAVALYTSPDGWTSQSLVFRVGFHSTSYFIEARDLANDTNLYYETSSADGHPVLAGG